MDLYGYLIRVSCSGVQRLHLKQMDCDCTSLLRHFSTGFFFCSCKNNAEMSRDPFVLIVICIPVKTLVTADT